MDDGVVGMQLLMPTLWCWRTTPKFFCLAGATENSPVLGLARKQLSLHSATIRTLHHHQRLSFLTNLYLLVNQHDYFQLDPQFGKMTEPQRGPSVG